MPSQNREIIEVSGKTVDEAVQEALRRLRLSRAQVDVTVVMEGRPGVFGIGATRAVVRVRPLGGGPTDAEPSAQGDPLPKIDDYAKYQEVSREEAGRGGAGGRTGRGRSGGDRGGEGRSGGSRGGRRGRRGPDRAAADRPQPVPFDLLADPDYEPVDDPVEHASNVLRDLLHLLGVEADVRTRKPESPMDGLDHAVAVLDVVPAAPGDDLSLLIGHQGEHLGALQYNVNLILSHSYDDPHPITVDVAGYKRGREDTLNALARDMAARVRDTREAVTLDPMPPAERRILHLALGEEPDIATESRGEGDARRVQIQYRERD